MVGTDRKKEKTVHEAEAVCDSGADGVDEAAFGVVAEAVILPKTVTSIDNSNKEIIDNLRCAEYVFE